MSMRFKVFFSLAATVIILISVMHLITKDIFAPRFAELEQLRLPRIASQVHDELGERCQQLGVRLRDWAHSTKARDFLAGKESDFARDSFSDGTLGEMQVSALVYTDLNGVPRLTLGADERGKEMTVPASLLKELTLDGRLSAGRSKAFAGLIREPDRLYEFAVGPVLNTDGSGPPAGMCFFARQVGLAETARIQSGCDQKIDILPISDEQGHSILASSLADRNGFYVKRDGDEWLSVYRPLNDFSGTPIALAHSILPRDVYLEGRHVITTISIELAVTGVLLGGLTFLLFETLVLSRVSRISKQLQHLASEANLSTRVTFEGNDELGDLARPVNALLQSIETANKTLVAQQKQLTISEHRLTTALAATGDGLWDWSKAAGLYLSPGWFQILEVPVQAGSFDPREIISRLHEADRDRLSEAMIPIHSNETDTLAVDIQVQLDKGRAKWVEIRGQVVERGPNGEPVRIVGLSQDVTQRRAAETAMRESRELFRNAFDESATGMAMVSLEGRFLRVNAQFCEVTGYSAAELEALTFSDITHPEDLNLDVMLWDSLIGGERRHYSIEKRYIRKDGHIVWVLINVGVVFDGAGKALYSVGQVQDITQRKRSEDELQAYALRLLTTKEELERRSIELADKTVEAELAKRAAEEASRAKSTFLTHMSHEIRTPMTGILGFADLLLQNNVSPDEHQRYVESILRNGQHLLALMNDILDLSKIEAGKMTLEVIECDPIQIVADVEAMSSTRAQSKNVRLSVNIAGDVPRKIRSDPTRLCQILLNVVGNAIKFTDVGEIGVDVSLIGGDTDSPRLRFVISDSGIGMTATQIDRLFEPFQQADVSTTRRFGGTGLGLAISKRLVEMLDGNITVHSEAGQGTQFCVTIGIGGRVIVPEFVPSSASAEKVEEPVPSLAGLRILLAEDGPDNQYLIRFHLEHADASVDIAEDGRLAVERMNAVRDLGEAYDLILMDIQMPEMDGLDATRTLRASGFTLPILALTAHGTADAREQSLKAGCCDHLIKPIQYDTLIRRISFWVGKSMVGNGVHSAWESNEDFETVLKDYVAELPRQVIQLLENMTRNDLDGLRRTVHQIRGAGGGYGFANLSSEAEQVESVIAKKRLDSVAQNVDKLITAIRSVHGYDPLLERDNASARPHH